MLDGLAPALPVGVDRICCEDRVVHGERVPGGRALQVGDAVPELAPGGRPVTIRAPELEELVQDIQASRAGVGGAPNGDDSRRFVRRIQKKPRISPMSWYVPRFHG